MISFRFSPSFLPRLNVLTWAILLSACSQMPTYERPIHADNLPVAKDWATLEASNQKDQKNTDQSTQKQASDLAWSDFFSDANLRELIQLALNQNRDLRVAALNIEQARAQWQIRRADELPAINGVLSGSRTSRENGISSTYSAGLMMSSFEIDLWGRIQSLSEQAVSQYLATTEAKQAIQISLISSLASTWLTWKADQELLSLTEQTLKTREESLKLIELRFKNGASSELDFRQAQSLVENARATLAQQKRQLMQDQNTLTLLVGQPIPETLLKASSASLAETQFPDVPAGLPSDLLIQRPDIRQSEQQLIAANANIGAARAAFFPRISLTASVGTASSELSNLFQSGSWGFTLAPQLALPLFDHGKNEANLEVAQTTQKIAVAQYEKAIQTAFKEVSDALVAKQTFNEQLNALKDQAKSEQRRYELSNLRYQNGIASNLDVLDAQRALFATQQAVLQTQSAQLQSQVQLYKVLGGGWK